MSVLQGGTDSGDFQSMTFVTDVTRMHGIYIFMRSFALVENERKLALRTELKGARLAK